MQKKKQKRKEEKGTTTTTENMGQGYPQSALFVWKEQFGKADV